VFDVQDVLGSKGYVKARRLRKGGVYVACLSIHLFILMHGTSSCITADLTQRVYAHIEIEQKCSTNIAPTPRSLFSSMASTSPASGRMLKLRLRGGSLVLTHSRIKQVVAKNIPTKPDTYYEISRPSSSSMGMWIVLYRSPPVKESVSPTWDEAVIDLGSFRSPNSEAESPSDDLGAYPVRITVYKVKRTKCKEIGSFETTIKLLLEANMTMAKVTGFEDEQSTDGQTADEGEADKGTFRLRPTAKGGVDRSDEITGEVTVVGATVESSEEAWKRSRRFLSETDDDDDKGSFCAMSDGDSSSANIPRQMLPTGSRPKFSDYVTAGKVDVDFCVAIDFTSSNGDPRIPGTQVSV